MNTQIIAAMISGSAVIIAAIIAAVAAFIKSKGKAPQDKGPQGNERSSISINIDNKIGGEKERIGGSSMTSIKLKEKYTSLYTENGHLQSESIIIDNNNDSTDSVEGTVVLNDKYKYRLKGSFNNKILTGEYYSLNKHDDERGTINLKLISEDILSGFCSFSKVSSSADDQIRVSPYVWVAGEGKNLLNGTYEFCNECFLQNRKCCCESDEVDMPVLVNDESTKIHNLSPRNNKPKNFSTQINNTCVRQINRKDKGECYFFSHGKCKIYENRPTDCRLFPFDIVLDKASGEYWVGYYTDICNKELPQKEEMKKHLHILRPYLFLLYPYANIVTSDKVCEKLSQATFERLYTAREFIF